MIPNVNQLTAQLRMMADPVLQRVAMMYKQDPYILPMVIAEDAARKKMRQAAQAQMARGPQPKVVDQAIASLGYTPEEVGIGALPAQNMQGLADGGIAGYAEGGVSDTAEDAFSRGGMFDFAERSEPVVRMAGGGAVPGYAAGKRVRDFEAMIRSEAERQGVDPDIAVRMFMAETGGEADATTAVSSAGAVGLGQLRVAAARDMGLRPEERKDPVKNIQASVGYLKRQLDKYGSYDKALAAYNFGPGNLDKHLQKNKGELNPVGLPKETADYLTKIMPVGTAVAQPKTAFTAASQIPGQAVSAPASTEQPEGFFGRMGTRMGLSEEAKRNIANLNTAIGGALGPAYIPSYVAKTPQVVPGIDALAGRIYNVFSPQRVVTAEQAAQMQKAADTARTAEAVRSAQRTAQEAGATLEEGAALVDLARRTQATQRAERAAQIPSAAERIQAASRAGEAQQAARLGQVARAGQYETRASALDKILDEKGAAAEKFTPMPEYDRSRGQGAFLGETELPKEVKKEALATAKEELPKSDRKGLSNDDLVEIGLRMMASPGTKGEGFAGLLKSAGAAGLGALAARREREKTAMEERKLKSEEAYRTSLGRKAEAEASYYEAQRGPAQAMQIANTAYNNWAKELSPIERSQMSEETKAAKYQFFVQQAFENLGLPLPSGVTSQMAGQAPVIPQNVTVRQTG